MKTSKAPENTQVTPPSKKLKQARLPFKLISDVSPKPAASATRKRKLSVQDTEPLTKVGKVCKENGLIEDLVVISDDDSKDGQKPQNQDKPLNPYVNLVDKARKKKLQKSKTPKKKVKSRSSKNHSATDTNESDPDKSVTDSFENDIEMVEVEVLIHTNSDDADCKTNTVVKDNEKNTDKTQINDEMSSSNEPQMSTDTIQKLPENTMKPVESATDIVCLEDSNNSLDVKQIENIDTKQAKVILESKKKNITSKDKELGSPNKSDTNDAELKLEGPETPKRSPRNKVKAEQGLNLNSSSSKLDESICSEPSTPKTTRSSSVTSGDKSMNESSTNLTPKQLQKKLESAKKKEERDKDKREREIKKQLEKEEKAKQRQEKEEQKKREREEKEEAKRKEKEEKEDQKRKEREEKEKQRDLEKKQKEMKEEQKKKEKEEKEEQRKKEREAKEEEKRKKQEALEQEKQEQEMKKKKAAEAFVNFFVPKQKVEKDHIVGPVSKNSMLSSFAIKGDMRLAPTVRADLSAEKREMLDKTLEEQNLSKSALYLESLAKGAIKPMSSGKTWPKDDDDIIMIVEDELPPMDSAGEVITCEPATREKLRPKLLSFHENRRPPYWGTWRKKSLFIKPRKPFGQDEKQLYYEVDSDEEWEEEQEGESLDGSACGSDEEDVPGDDYEVDNEVFVPHGYLSDEEATMEEDDVLSLTPETQKARLKHLEDEFESEMKKPTEKLKPRLYGPLWETKDGGKPDNCVDALWNYFSKFAMIMNDPTPLLQPSNEPEEVEKKKVKKKKAVTEGDEQSPKTDKKKKLENKESKKPKTDVKKTAPNQPGINSFLRKLKTT